MSSTESTAPSRATASTSRPAMTSSAVSPPVSTECSTASTRVGRSSASCSHEVVHELRTPLAVATTNLELAASDPAIDGETSTQVAAARRAIDRMGRAVDDLAAHGRLSLDGSADVLTDLAKEAHALAAEHVGPASTRGIQLSVVAPTVVQTTVDRAAVRGAVGNLLANAVRLAPGSSTITVGCGQRDGWAWMAVRDEGPGIAPTEHALVFERYWQGRYESDRRPTNDQSGPHGLGLTIARQLVEAQGGQLTMQSEPGIGSTFVVWLPAAPDADASRDRRAGRHPSLGRSHEPAGSGRAGLTPALSPVPYVRPVATARDVRPAGGFPHACTARRDARAPPRAPSHMA